MIWTTQQLFIDLLFQQNIGPENVFIFFSIFLFLFYWSGLGMGLGGEGKRKGGEGEGGEWLLNFDLIFEKPGQSRVIQASKYCIY